MTHIIYSTKNKYYQHEFNEWGNMQPGDYWRKPWWLWSTLFI